MEEGPGRGGLHIAATGTLARVGRGAGATAAMPAFGAFVTVGPLELRQVGEATVLVRKTGLKLKNR